MRSRRCSQTRTACGRCRSPRADYRNQMQPSASRGRYWRQREMAESMNGRKLHFIAIGGAGMSGLALVAKELGAEVTGSDRAESSYVDRLRAAGIQPYLGHDADQVPAGAEVVV